MLADCILKSGITSNKNLGGRSAALLREALQRCLESIYQKISSEAKEMSSRDLGVPFNLEDGAEVSSRMKSEISEIFHFFSSLTQVSPTNIPFTDGEQDERLPNDYLSGRKWMYSFNFPETFQMQISRNPKQHDDDLSTWGAIVGAGYLKDGQTRGNQSVHRRWIYKLSLAMDEHSVSHRFVVRILQPLTIILGFIN